MKRHKEFSEEDVKNRYITPALEESGWSKEQMRMEFPMRENLAFTDGKVIIKGKTAKRGKKKSADYLLYHHNNFPIAIVEAKDMNHELVTGFSKRLIMRGFLTYRLRMQAMALVL